MNSYIFNYIGIGSLDPAYLFIGAAVLIIILFILLIVQERRNRKMMKRLSKFMKGKEAASLEDEIVELFEDNQYMRSATEKNKKDINDIYKKMARCFSKIGIIKYDAFQQMGGQLSFSLALLDDNDNGFILNSVHSVDGCYSYTKEVKHGECALDLGDEERQALEKAIEQ
ncbi:MAG: DUF4446 family protein [Butyrivibrio sp.]|jgi:hypothetical protein|nr:DUF4446 family protein [Butyrivibrio sp.]